MKLPATLVLLLVLAIPMRSEDVPLTNLSRLELIQAAAAPVTYRGFAALRVTQDRESAASLAVIKGLAFHNGDIDVDVAGAPAAGADAGARGFIGIAFRVAPGAARFENIYIRPTNGRAGDQLRRNHATQYESVPDWPWHRLRQESPGVYESYADIAPGEWTHLRIRVHGTDAALFVNGAPQPCLIVHDMKLGDTAGGAGLWIGPGTEGYFRNLSVTRAE